MMNGVDKYSTDNIADNEMIIAVDDVVKKDYDSAVVRIKKALARLKSTGHVEKYAEYLNILGLVYELENDESKAFECYLESLATAEIIRSRDLKAMVYSNISSSYSKMGRDKEAQRYFNDARDEYDSSSEKSEECHKSWVMFDYINHAIKTDMSHYLEAISLQIGFPIAENFSSYSVMMLPSFIAAS